MLAKLVALKNNKKRGFTLIELIVVIAIIGILIAILVPTALGFMNDARDAQLAANAKTVFVAAQAHLTKLSTETSTVPTSLAVTALTDYLGTFDTGGATYTINVNSANFVVDNVTATRGTTTVVVTSSGVETTRT